MNLLFILLKLPNKRREEYSKNIHFILYYSLLPNKTLSHLSYDCWVATLMFKIFHFSNKTKPSSKCCIPKNRNIVSRPSAFQISSSNPSFSIVITIQLGKKKSFFSKQKNNCHETHLEATYMMMTKLMLIHYILIYMHLNILIILK